MPGKSKSKSNDPSFQAYVDKDKEEPVVKPEVPKGLCIWTKPSGDTILLNEHPATVAHAEKMGWKR